MAAKTSIEWTERTWNPIRGCTRISPGCGGPGSHGGCYAEKIAARFSGPGMAYEGLAEMRGGKARWTGKLSFGHDLDAPLRWRKPQRIFVNSMSDLFHESLDIAEIATVFAVCVAAHHVRGHIFQDLTKRSGRMREVLHNEEFWDQVNAEAGALVLDAVDPLDRRSTDARATLDEYGPDNPPPGIWLGVSVEDQTRADERRDDLATLADAGWTTFASYEPALGPVDWRGWQFLKWLISGGESGPKARPYHRQWFRDARDFCESSGIAYFHKQNGGWGRANIRPSGTEGRFAFCNAPPFSDFAPAMAVEISRYPRMIDLFGGGTVLELVGKKAAGRLLDGVEHNGMPGVASHA